MTQFHEALDFICKTWKEELLLRTKNMEKICEVVQKCIHDYGRQCSTSEEKVLPALNDLIMPCIQNLKKGNNLNETQLEQINIIESHLRSPFMNSRPALMGLNLTPREMQVANLILSGKTTKEIAELLNLSTSSIDFHRNHLREKLGIRNKKTNLRGYLLSMSH